MALYEDLLKKEGEITALKVKAMQLMRNHEEAIGYDDIKLQLQQLGNVSAFMTVTCALIGFSVADTLRRELCKSSLK